jgi:TolB-like protein/DNA-binding winged helix-turn-helix (wHTH) protein/Tfp pilus assembly protein PilF
MGSSAADSGIVRFGPFELDVRNYELRKEGIPVHLPPQPCRVLALLASQPHRVISRQEIQQKIWSSDTFVDFEQGLNVCIRQIRAALADDAESPRYVETLSRRGYRFIARVEESVDSDASAHVGATDQDLVGRPQKTARWWRQPWAIGGLAVTAALIVVALVFQLGRRAPALALGNSVAVLPLHSLSDDPEQRHFADAMTDLMLTDLGQIPQLRVVSRQSVLQYEQSQKTVPQIARELHVDCIVEGTVSREGQRVRITAQLIHGPTDHHLWTQSYERDLSDIFALQQDVAEAIAREVGVKLAPTPRPREARHVAPAVYEAYLRGVYLLDEGQDDAAVVEFRKAVAADPTYAPAYTKIAGAYFGRGFYGTMPPDQAFSSMKEAALRAIELDDNDAEAHAWLAIEKLHYAWDWPGAEREFRRSLQLNPSEPEVRHMYAHYLLTMGHQQESMNEMERAFETDPVGLEVPI